MSNLSYNKDVAEEINWIKNYLYYEELDTEKIQNILYFMLVWNIFENKFENNHAKISDSKDIAEKLYAVLENNIVDNIWNYYVKRYTSNNTINEIFTKFKFNENDNKVFVQNQLLLADKATKKDKIEALLRISFRLRNNLFHGIKKVHKLYNQNNNFKQINMFLMHILDNSSSVNF